MSSLSIQGYDPKENESLIAFIQEYSWLTTWSPEMFSQFVLTLSDPSKLFFDLSVNQQRVAVGILLDQYENLGNHANLEVLAIRPDFQPRTVYETLIPLASERLPSKKSGIEVSFEKATIHHFEPFDAFLSIHQLTPYLQIFEMKNDQVTSLSVDDSQISRLNECDLRELYEVLKESFKENLDSNTSPFEVWARARRNSQTLKTWVYQSSGKIVGFINLFVPPILDFEHDVLPEIRTVGVLGPHRGIGIASKLIKVALTHLASLSIRSCKLGVAAHNENALKLYQNLGFTKTRHFLIYERRK